MQPENVPKTLREGIERAERQGLELHENAYGTVIDPKPVQLGAIREGFREAARQDDFNIFTVVDPRRVRDDMSMQQNFRRVYDRWEDATDEVAQEVADQLEEMGHDVREGAAEGQQ